VGLVSKPPCAGDCNLDGQVTIDELNRITSIALGTESIDACRAADVSREGLITVDEQVLAVNHALDGCH
jgi:hypothetical protein